MASAASISLVSLCLVSLGLLVIPDPGSAALAPRASSCEIVRGETIAEAKGTESKSVCEGDAAIRPRRLLLPCHTAAQTVSKLQGISCRGAVNVVEAAYGTVQPHFPECPGDGARQFGSWRLTAHPLNPGTAHPGIGTRFSKAGKSFLVTGGGVC
jgi:hypothetical protein